MRLNLPYLALLMAYIFSAAKLLPATHPYLHTNNYKRFGIRHVLADAYSRLKFDWKHTDQIILYGTVVFSLIVLLVQFAAIMFFVVSSTAHAAGAFQGFFSTVPPDNDIAFMVLDKTFGVPNIFMSHLSPNALGYIPVFHEALHAMFAFYSRAMLFVGILILLYYFFAMLVESIQEGKVFGERFAKVYAPMRLVIAIMLMLPLAYGLNSGQYLTLYAAKWGSSFATNAWKSFNIGFQNALNSDPETLIAKPNAPDIQELVQFFSIVHACKIGYKTYYSGANDGALPDVKPYIVNAGKSPDYLDVSAGVTYTQAAEFSQYGTIKIIYGIRDPQFAELPGSVRPYCGAIEILTQSIDKPFARDIYASYFQMTKDLWNAQILEQVAERMTRIIDPALGDPCDVTVPGWTECNANPPLTYLSDIVQYHQAQFNATLAATLDPANLAASNDLMYDPGQMERGWGGAGLWFNKLADMNGAVISATYNAPTAADVPQIMDYVVDQKRAADVQISAENIFDPETGSGNQINWSGADRRVQDRKLASLFARIYNLFGQDMAVSDNTGQGPGMLGFMIAEMFGANGLFDIRSNKDIHPLAQMTAMGRTIMETSIRNLMIATALNTLGAANTGYARGMQNTVSHLRDDDPNYAAIMEAAGPYSQVGGGLTTIGAGFYSLAGITLTLGFVLCYIIPLLPFMYFFFGITKWVMSIFEAMVAIPLWALAHLRIDGDGLPGQAAANGYYMILEIFLRPILIVIGMIAGISIFTACAFVMNETWDLVTVNVTGYDGGSVSAPDGTPQFLNVEYFRQGVDTFFFTLLYAVVLYMLSMACFKMIDQIPQQILRWIGNSVESLADKMEDPSDSLIRYSAMGGGQLGGEAIDIAKDSTSFVGTTAAMPVGMGAAMGRMSQRN